VHDHRERVHDHRERMHDHCERAGPQARGTIAA
jgi:hypothetical protein